MPDEVDEELLSLSDFERAAAARLSDRAAAYINSGAADEISMRDNLDGWQRLALRPRIFAGVGRRDPSVVLLSRPRPHPLIIAPTAFARLTHPDGEVAVARAAAATETPFCLSTLATTSIVDLAAEVPEAPRWFQMYVFTDRGISREMMDQAAANGYEALVVTGDRPVLGVRERERRGGVRDGAAAAPADPASKAVGGARPQDFSRAIDADLRWSDVAQLAAESSLPLIVKGLLTAEDALLAAEHGAAAVVVSNHGGRQLDTTLSGVDALPEVVDAVGDRLDVIVDGGVRRGSDVVKALALGAKAVMVGRPLLWGLACGGAAGAQRVLELLLAELDTNLALVGAPAARQLDRSFVCRAPWAAD